MQPNRVLGGLLALAMALAACGDSDSDATQATAAASNDEAGTGEPGQARLGTTALGEVIVGADGRTLYGFSNDTAAASSCYDSCADAWPPVIVDDGWTVGPGLDTGIFATTVRDDGQLQLVAGTWPLYYYGDDTGPGDVNGQGSGGVWFVAGPDGSLITDADADTDTDTDGSVKGDDIDSGGY